MVDNNAVNSKTFDTTHFPAFTSKGAIVRAIRDFADEAGVDAEDLINCVWLTDTTGLADGATVTAAGLDTAMAVQ